MDKFRKGMQTLGEAMSAAISAQVTQEAQERRAATQKAEDRPAMKQQPAKPAPPA